jgi:ubiquinone/menaquinone biosynthesis C-methylase UbiE
VFDAAYLVTVLGEIPGRLAAPIGLCRVLEPGGRLVIGEFADRHHVPLATLVRLANDAGLHLLRRTGVPLAGRVRRRGSGFQSRAEKPGSQRQAAGGQRQADSKQQAPEHRGAPQICSPGKAPPHPISR